MTALGCVILSQGNRPDQLNRLIASLQSQRDVELNVLVVGNGWQPTGLPAGVETTHLSENLGVPAGRNFGAHRVSGDVLLFVDDDIEFTAPDLAARAVAAFDADARLGVLQPRSIDREGGPTATRHVPRLLGIGPQRSGDVAWFWEGCSFIRRTAFDAVGGWPGEFFYGHEGIELAWRLVDLGYRVHYAADLGVLNPPAEPFRGEQHRFMDGRNRVWVARRNLPWPVAIGYLLTWFFASMVRARARQERAALVRGFRAGFRQPALERRPIRWGTVLRLTRLGRPPLV